MKLCVCGKGGSGKSSVVALLAQALKNRGKSVLVLDSDESNASLFRMLGLDRSPRPLMDLVGGKKIVQQKMMANFSRGQDEPAMTIWERDELPTEDIPAEYIVAYGGVKLVATGKIHQALEGCACPMGTVTREFLKKLVLLPEEVAVVDMEAGIEHFGRGVEGSVDWVVNVVEPSMESISMAKKIMDLTESAGARYKGSILNKVSSPAQQDYMSAKLGEVGVPIVGILPFDEKIQAAGLEGRCIPQNTALAGMAVIADRLLQ